MRRITKFSDGLPIRLSQVTPGVMGEPDILKIHVYERSQRRDDGEWEYLYEGVE